MLNIREPGPPPSLSIIRLVRYCPRTTNSRIGSIQENRKLSSGDCSV